LINTKITSLKETLVFNQKQKTYQQQKQKMVEVTGLEPATYCLQSSRSPS
jgi:hypothetical protein